jgi:tRNA (cytosine38-C5)-methyltransferase
MLSHLDDDSHFFLLSQPHTATKAADQLDSSDSRSAGLKHLISLLKSLISPPKWIFLENVKGFHGSDMQNALMAALKEQSYTWQQFLVSPVQVGVPNNRKRFYLLCERSGRFQGDEANLFSEFPDRSIDPEWKVECLHKYVIEPPMEEGIQTKELYLSSSLLAKPWARGLSVVSAFDRITFCFTGSYGKVFHKSSGKVYLAGLWFGTAFKVKFCAVYVLR